MQFLESGFHILFDVEQIGVRVHNLVEHSFGLIIVARLFQKSHDGIAARENSKGSVVLAFLKFDLARKHLQKRSFSASVSSDERDFLFFVDDEIRLQQHGRSVVFHRDV